MNHLLRRSAALATAAPPRSLAAASDLIVSLLSTAAAPIGAPAARVKPSFVPRRGFHVSAGPVRFRDTEAVCGGQAAQAVYEEAGEGLEIARLGIAQEIVDSLARKGIMKLFPIQKAVLEPAMQGYDMIGRAKTGTGKTLAFGIPILDKILQFQKKHGRGRNPMALVLAPTRELARQVEKEFKESAPVVTLCVYGGAPIQQQMRDLHYGVDVIVGTPGRVTDLLNRGALVLSEVQFVVLDEADEMLNVGFAEAVEKILEKLPLQRQSLMFSATMPPVIRNLTNKYLKSPVIIDLVGENDQKLAEGITLYSIAAEKYSKASILATLITEHAKGGKCIVFTETKRDADQLAYFMSRSLSCQPLHGDISQQQRERTLAGFRDGAFNVLIATDVAARGLDVPNVDLVIHYELPKNSEIFVHRSGRTGRAGKKGSVIVIYSREQSRTLKGIELDTGGTFTELPEIKVEGGGLSTFGGMGGQFGSYNRTGGGGYNNGPPRSYGGGGGGYSRPSSGGYSGYGNRYASPQATGSTQGGFGGQGFGRPGGYTNSGQGSGYNNSGQGGGYTNSGQGGVYNSSAPGSTGGYPASTGSLGNFGNSGQGQSYGNSSNSIQEQSYGIFGNSGQGQPSSNPGQGQSNTNRYGGFGQDTNGSGW